MMIRRRLCGIRGTLINMIIETLKKAGTHSEIVATALCEGLSEERAKEV